MSTLMSKTEAKGFIVRARAHLRTAEQALAENDGDLVIRSLRQAQQAASQIINPLERNADAGDFAGIRGVEVSGYDEPDASDGSGDLAVEVFTAPQGDVQP